MKTKLVMLAMYSFVLPVVISVAAMFFDPNVYWYVSHYPTSFALERLTDGLLSVIPCAVLSLFVYNHVIKGNEKERNYYNHRRASISTMMLLSIIVTFTNIVLLLTKYKVLVGIVWKHILFCTIHPVSSVILTLIIYGLSFMIARHLYKKKRPCT